MARKIKTYGLVLTRSDAGDGGWSLHPAGTTDEQIAEGLVEPLLTGEADMVDGAWDRPTEADYREAAEIAWWRWHDADYSRTYGSMEGAEAACAAWVAGDSETGPERAA